MTAVASGRAGEPALAKAMAGASIRAPATAAPTVIRPALCVKRFTGDPPNWDDRGLWRSGTSMAGEGLPAGQIAQLIRREGSATELGGCAHLSLWLLGYRPATPGLAGPGRTRTVMRMPSVCPSSTIPRPA